MTNKSTNWVKVLVWIVVVVIVVFLVLWIVNETLITGGSEGAEKAGIILLNL